MRCIKLFLLIAFIFISNSSLWAASTEITYQGQLKQNGTIPATTTVNLEFKLFNASTGGTQVGNTVTKSGVPVISGLFTVGVDFQDSSLFNGELRFLDISVNGQSLSARQPLTPVPYAIGATRVDGTGVSVGNNTPGTVLVATNSGGGVTGYFEKTGAANTNFCLAVRHFGVGDPAVFQNAAGNVARISNSGAGFFNGGMQSNGADIAEALPVVGGRDKYFPGDVLVLSVDQPKSVERSSKPYSTLVAGVYATRPGVLLTQRHINEDLSDLVPMGVVGVIPTKVTTENGPIRVGDLLVTSSTPGHAMKGTDSQRMMGAIIGKAMENFDGSSAGAIDVLVNVK